MTAPKGTLPVPLDMALRTRCRALYEAGSTFADIESETGVKAGTARSWKARDKWTRESESSGELTIVGPDEIEISEDMDPREQADTYESDMRVAALKFSNHVKNLPPDQIAAKADRIKSLDVVNRKALKIETERPPVAIQIGVLCSSPAKRDQERLRSLIRPVKPEQLDLD